MARHWRTRQMFLFFGLFIAREPLVHCVWVLFLSPWWFLLFFLLLSLSVCVCVCVCVRERERERERECVCVRERERERVCVCVCVCDPSKCTRFAEFSLYTVREMKAGQYWTFFKYFSVFISVYIYMFVIYWFSSVTEYSNWWVGGFEA